MEKVLSFARIQARFRSEWVLVIDPVTDADLEIVRGRVAFHSKDRDDVYRRAAALRPKSFALLFTGKLPKDTAIVL
ncbi:MAG: hypothetical protein HYZ53_03575 [Planctomycetes bacterium]|nr:hypothetical protein [Planctomycetota bacterium]